MTCIVAIHHVSLSVFDQRGISPNYTRDLLFYRLRTHDLWIFIIELYDFEILSCFDSQF